MTVVLFLTCLWLATTTGYLCCGLVAARRIHGAQLAAQRVLARECRMRAEHAQAMAAADAYWLTVVAERDQQIQELVRFLAVVKL